MNQPRTADPEGMYPLNHKVPKRPHSPANSDTKSRGQSPKRVRSEAPSASTAAPTPKTWSKVLPPAWSRRNSLTVGDQRPVQGDPKTQPSSPTAAPHMSPPRDDAKGLKPFEDQVSMILDLYSLESSRVSAEGKVKWLANKIQCFNGLGKDTQEFDGELKKAEEKAQISKQMQELARKNLALALQNSFSNNTQSGQGGRVNEARVRKLEDELGRQKTRVLALEKSIESKTDEIVALKEENRNLKERLTAFRKRLDHAQRLQADDYSAIKKLQSRWNDDSPVVTSTESSMAIKRFQTDIQDLRKIDQSVLEDLSELKKRVTDEQMASKDINTSIQARVKDIETKQIEQEANIPMELALLKDMVLSQSDARRSSDKSSEEIEKIISTEISNQITTVKNAFKSFVEDVMANHRAGLDVGMEKQRKKLEFDFHDLVNNFKAKMGIVDLLSNEFKKFKEELKKLRERSEELGSNAGNQQSFSTIQDGLEQRLLFVEAQMKMSLEQHVKEVIGPMEELMNARLDKQYNEQLEIKSEFSSKVKDLDQQVKDLCTRVTVLEKHQAQQPAPRPSISTASMQFQAPPGPGSSLSSAPPAGLPSPVSGVTPSQPSPQTTSHGAHSRTPTPAPGIDIMNRISRQEKILAQTIHRMDTMTTEPVVNAILVQLRKLYPPLDQIHGIQLIHQTAQTINGLNVQVSEIISRIHSMKLQITELEKRALGREQQDATVNKRVDDLQNAYFELDAVKIKEGIVGRVDACEKREIDFEKVCAFLLFHLGVPERDVKLLEIKNTDILIEQTKQYSGHFVAFRDDILTRIDALAWDCGNEGIGLNIRGGATNRKIVSAGPAPSRGLAGIITDNNRDGNDLELDDSESN